MLSKIEMIFKQIELKEISKEEALKQIEALNAEEQSSDTSLSMDSGSFPVVEDKAPSYKQADEQADAGLSISHTSLSISQLEDRIQDFIIKKLFPDMVIENKSEMLSENFLNLGLDSFKLIELTKGLEDTFSIVLYPTILFEYPNIEKISSYLASDFKDNMLKYFDVRDTEKPQVKVTVKQDVKQEVKQGKNPQPAAVHTKTDTTIQTGQTHNTQYMDIAVIGMAGVFAGSPDINSFWRNIITSKDSITEIPSDRFNYRDWLDDNKENPDRIYCKWGGFIQDVDKFDAAFFNISDREADLMDPQLRILLQTVYHGIEDAGYAGKIAGSLTGIYVGVSFHDYLDDMIYNKKVIAPHDVTGNALSMISNRASYILDIRGPSLSIDTACSSSLVALHLACQALKNKECDLAIVASANCILSSFHYRHFCSINALSPTGRCHSFDKEADGYVPGEGVAALVVKPLNRAIMDNDRIYAVIKGSTANHGGRTPSVTAPSIQLEAQAMIDTWKNAKIDPATISYLETHGTGTKLGDPIEIEAINQAFAQFTNKTNFCAIGTAKTNVGHTEASAGLTGVIKTILSMQNRLIPVMPNFKELNPFISLENSPIYINNEIIRWTRAEDHIPLRAGVNSFGFGGAYAHVLLEEFNMPDKVSSEESMLSQLFLFTAKKSEALDSYVQKIIQFIKNYGSEAIAAMRETVPVDLPALAYSLQTKKDFFKYRLAVVAHNTEDLLHKLNHFINHKADNGIFVAKVEKNKNPAQMNDNESVSNEFINTLVKKGDLNKIVQLWMSGVLIDWEALYTGNKPRKISLPAYPFMPVRHWYNGSAISNKQKATPIEKSANVSHAVSKDFISTSKQKYKMRLKEEIKDILQLKDSSIADDEEFMNYGFDSITYTEFANRLSAIYKIEASPAIFYEHRCVESLTEYLIKESGDSTIEEQAEEQAEAAKSNNFYEKKNLDEPLYEPKIKNQNTINEFTSHVDVFDKNRKNMKSNEKIAVIGLSCKFPGSDNVDEFWKNLEEKKDLITEVPADRWHWEDYYGDPREAGDKTFSKWGGFLNDVASFDSLFFGISPKEAEFMDPQHRMIIEQTWEALEDAGYKSSELRGSNTGVFIGVSTRDYSDLMRERKIGYEAVASIGNCFSILANRVSFLMDWHGPSEPIDTACSSALFAIHRGVEAIRNGESDLVVAGGINLILSPCLHVSFSKSGMLSPDGRCRSFDARANGYVRGEGCGVILLKSLNKAIQDGDHIYGVIAGSAINHGGRSSSLTAPNPVIQAELIYKTYSENKINIRNINYIEAHGTGTRIGDPIEINGLKDGFKKLYKERYSELPTEKSCGLGSVKTNIGHLEAAAGIAGIIKVLLMLNKKKIPGTVHFQELNPNIQIENTPFYVVKDTTEWKRVSDEGKEQPLSAGINSFGFGGAYAHIILEEYMDEETEEAAENDNELIILSAKQKEKLLECIRRLKRVLIVNDTNADRTNKATGVDPAEYGKLESEFKSIISRMKGINIKEINLDENFEDIGLDITDLAQIIIDVNAVCNTGFNEKDSWQAGSITGLLKNFFNKNGKGNVPETQSNLIRRDLKQIAYTLQVGREEYDERLALIVKSIPELMEKLTKFEAGETHIPGLYYKNIKEKKNELWNIGEDEEGNEYLRSLLLKQKYDRLAQLWINGIKIDWKLGYSGKTIKRISLPQYPFARVRHWLFTGKTEKDEGRRITPLLGKNVSDFYGQKFITKINGEDFFVRDHIINGKMILPGAAYVEMGISAAVLSAKKSVKQVKNMYWLRPLIIENEADVELSLQMVDETKFEFQVRTKEGLHGKGELTLEENQAGVKSEGIRDWLSKGMEFEMSAEQCYGEFEKKGFNYGSGFRCLKKIYKRGNEVLAELCLPENLIKGSSQFTIHPSMLDGIFQAALGHLKNEQGLFVPYSISELEIFAPMGDKCYAYLKPGNEKTAFHIDVVDEAGNVKTRIKDFIIKNFKPELLNTSQRNFIKEHPELAGKVEEIDLNPAAEHNDIKMSAMDEAVKLFSNDSNEINLDVLGKKLQEDLKLNAGLVLKLEQDNIDAEEDISEYGFDSISTMEFINKLNKEFNINLTAAASMENRTISLLSKHIVSEYQEQIRNYFKGKKSQTGPVKEKEEKAKNDIRQAASDYKQESEPSKPAVKSLKQKQFDAAVPAPAPAPADKEKLPEAEAHDIGTFYLKGDWEESPLSAGKDEELKQGLFIVFDTEENQSALLEEKLLKETGEAAIKLIRVEKGKHFKQISEKNFIINPDEAEDFIKLRDTVLLPGPRKNFIMYLWSASDFGDGSRGGIFPFFYLLKSLTTKILAQRTKILYIYEQGNFNPEQSGMSGLAKTIQGENTKLYCKSVGIRGESSPAKKSMIIFDELKNHANMDILYENSVRKVYHYHNSTEDIASIKTQIRENGVYVISGGAGGLGLLIAERLTQNQNCCVILCGRSPLSKSKLKRIKNMATSGSTIEYNQVDITNQNETDEFIHKVIKEHKTINGIIHSAGIILDGYIKDKNIDNFKKVISVKIDGIKNLDYATRDQELDFFIVFSSISAVLGNAEQSDYAYANCVMDRYIEWREMLRHENKRKGKGLSFNWPLWQEGGMKVSKPIEDYLAKNWGIHLLDTHTALEMFNRGLSHDTNSVLVIKGDVTKINKLLHQQDIITQDVQAIL